MMRFVRWVACAIAALGLSTSALAQQQSVPGTIVSMTPPPDFTLSRGFAGFENADTGASVLIVELPAEGFGQISAILSDLKSANANMASQGITMATREDVTLQGGQKALLFTGIQRVGDVTVDKWLLVVAPGLKTVMLTIQAPQEPKLDDAIVRGAIQSVVLQTAEPTIEQKLASLPFVIKPAEPFRVIDLIGGAGVMLTVGPLDVDPSGTQPSIIATYQVSAAVVPADLVTYAEQAVRALTTLKDLTINGSEATTFGGVKGVLTRGSYVESTGITKRFVHYFAVNDEGRYLRMVVRGDEAQLIDLRAAIEAIAASMAFRK